MNCKDYFNTSISQVIEHQTHTGRGHQHGVGWARNLSPSVVQLFHRLQKEDAHQLGRGDLEPVVAIGRASITVSTMPEDIVQQFPKLSLLQATEAGRLALAHQWHHCTESCESSVFPGQLCNKFFPQLPSLFPLVATTPLLGKEGQQRLEAIYEIHTRMQNLLRNRNLTQEEDSVASLLNLLKSLANPPEPLPNEEGFTWHSVVFPNGSQLQRFLFDCQPYGRTPGDVLLLSLYHMSLLTRRHAKYIPVRSVADVCIAKYNPIVLLATHANMEVDLILHTPAVWFKYMTKTGASQSSLKSSQSQLSSRGDNINGLRVSEMIEAKKREVTLGENFCLLDPQLSLASSNVTTKYVNTKFYPAGVDVGGVLQKPNQAVVMNYTSR